MRIARIELENVKRFEHFTLDIPTDERGTPLWRILLLGDNGSGKTTLLQAIAACLSLGTGQLERLDGFAWPGWLNDRYGSRGRPKIHLELTLSGDELEATAEVYELWRKSRYFSDEPPPGAAERIQLTLDGEQLDASPAALAQLRGRSQAKRLLRPIGARIRPLFGRLPGMFWFDQLRNLGGRATHPAGGDDGPVGVAALRKHLVRWWINRQAGLVPDQFDFLGQIEEAYARVFPGRRLDRPEPRHLEGDPDPEDYFFMLHDGQAGYELEEMSGGEQAVFPLLYEFARQQIRNSVVLIDEVDLHLHPPLAQTLLRSLPRVGPGCQFMLTTHTPAISETVGPDEIVRLEGGRLCL